MLIAVHQAARFRVYAYDNADKVIGELNERTGFRLKWTVHVMNTKAAAERINKEGTLNARNAGVVSGMRRRFQPT